MDRNAIAATISAGKAVLGIELGSTRIKAELIGTDHAPVASGSHSWENHYEDGIWTYSMDEVWSGLQDAYRDLVADVQQKYDVQLCQFAAIGFSAMMHGYLAFDEDGNQLAPFKTWRNTITAEAAEKLTAEFNFNVPQRWSIAHLYQCILENQEHVKNVRFFTTLSGYVHWKLTGQKVLGIGDAAGMFPIDSNINDYNADMLACFDELVADKNYPWKHLRDIMPQVLAAGEDAGALTAEGAKLLDPTGHLQAGIPLCPPEGDAGTGMVATDSVGECTGNISAGTSIFGMVVLQKPLSKVYPEIDMVTTPSGEPVAMVHCNNCTTDVNAWVNLFKEVVELTGGDADMGRLFTKLFNKSLEGDVDCGGVMPVNYYSGEGVTHFDAGCPMLLHGPKANFTLANLMRAHVYSTMVTLKLGMRILTEEQVTIKKLLGHGGLFKTPGVAQRYLAAATEAPVTVMSTAGEGGAWGIALLAAYCLNKQDGETLADYLDNKVFASMESTTIVPDAADVAGFNAFTAAFERALPAERAALATL